jgi:hypothetical protein
MTHIVRRIVDHIDVGKADNPHDKETERHGHQGLSEATDVAGRNRQMCDLGLCH